MQIITNNILPQKAISKLKNFGEIILFETEGIVYPAISNHPDVFFCPVGEELLVAPNLPEFYKNILNEKKIKFKEGKKPLGQKYPATAIYNTVVTQNHLIANTKVIDEKVLGLSANKKIIHVNQAYTRCNLLQLSEEKFITSDKGIFKVLEKEKMDVLYVNPAGIVLKGFKNGFFGGCCGVLENKVFIAGSLNHFAEREKVRGFLNDFEIVELYDGPLLDVGGVLMV
ncbi:MAG: hypothetical protein GXO88_04270 [Chlorobi bacterium]|nr:hypothetical protein [Chlorobiota bacterium]